MGPSKHDLHRTICILLGVRLYYAVWLPEHVAADKDFEYSDRWRSRDHRLQAKGGAVIFPAEGHAVIAIAKQLQIMPQSGIDAG